MRGQVVVLVEPLAVTVSFIAHRFGRDYGPDSSRSALAVSSSGRVAGYETDCVLTGDGEIVLLHDDLLARSTDGAGWARERPASYITSRRLLHPDGTVSDEHPLHFDDAIELLRPLQGLIQFEVKAFADRELAERTAHVLCEAIDRASVERGRVEVISFWPIAVEVAARRGFRSRVIIACPYVPGELAAWARRVGMSGVILEANYWDREPVDLWREAGLSVMSGVINDVELLRHVLRFSPDLVASDRPRELAREIADP